MTLFRNIFILLTLFFVASCASVNMLTINIERPAQITVPLDIASIAVVNNAVDQPKDIGHKYFMYKKEIGYVEVGADSITTILSGALAQFVDEAQFYARVSFYPYPLRSDLSFLEEKQIPASDVTEICEIEGVDAILSLDRFLVLLQSDKENMGDGVEMNSLTTRMQAKFSMYRKNGERLDFPIVHQDSLFWQEIAQGNYALTAPLPSYEDALKESAIHVATNLEGYFVPHWEEQNRWLYSDATTKLKQASAFANANKWDEAISIWESLYKMEDNSRKKARLASNLALGYEVSDKLTEALEWITIAYDLLEVPQKTKEDEDLSRAKAYKVGLQKRIEDFKTLDVQQGK